MLESTTLRALDLQGLNCLVALVSETSVTRAAEALDMSQPAMSRTLARLRLILNDPLLVRTSHGMQATPRALKLARLVGSHLRDLDAAFSEQLAFDPAAAVGEITIATADNNALMLFPSILRSLCERAPQLTLVMRYPDFTHVREWLEEGRCDLAVGFFSELADGLHSTMIYDEPFCCIESAASAQRGPMTLERYLGASHAIFNSPFSATPPADDILNRALTMRGLKRRAQAKLPSALLIGQVVATTPMIATLGVRLARHLAELFPLTIHELPFEAPSMRAAMVWHERTHRIELYRWLRRSLLDGMGRHDPEAGHEP